MFRKPLPLAALSIDTVLKRTGVQLLMAACLVAASCSARAQAMLAPAFTVDPYWPQPLPNHWVLGNTVGVAVDSRNHVWLVHRPASVETPFLGAAQQPPIAECCLAAPPVIEFDPAGNVVNAWGGPGDGYDWPDNMHGITVDSQGHVWLAGNGIEDTQILKFTRDGRFLLQVGSHGEHDGNADTANLWQPSKIAVDEAADEVFVSDGYGNRRVIVFDATTGNYKRHWGAYGAEPDDDPRPAYQPGAEPSDQFDVVHCVTLADDGLVYVCDRQNNRIQVFDRAGEYVREVTVDAESTAGTVWDIALSADEDQAWLYVVNGSNHRVHVLARDTLEQRVIFGGGGRQPGQFFGVHNADTDSFGNLYTTETFTGARVQKFVYRGLLPIGSGDRGVPW